MPASYAAHRALLEPLLRAWDMKPAFTARTAEVMGWTDLHGGTPNGMDTSHFFLALSPAPFRAEGDPQADVASLCDARRATRAVDPAQPVMVAGDPQRRYAARRWREGIPVGAGLERKVRESAAGSGTRWTRDEAA